MDTIGSRIATRRKELGLTQEALASAIGLSRGALAKIEVDENSPSYDALLKLATVLNRTLDWLAGKTLVGSAHLGVYAIHEHNDKRRQWVDVPLIDREMAANWDQVLADITIALSSERKSLWRILFEDGVQAGRLNKGLKEDKDARQTYSRLVSILRNSSQIPAPLRLVGDEIILAAEVQGDAMSGAHLIDGDIVYFCPGHIAQDGIYVLAVGDTVLVRRLQWDTIGGELLIISENPNHPTKHEPLANPSIKILGLVRGWTHIQAT